MSSHGSKRESGSLGNSIRPPADFAVENVLRQTGAGLTFQDGITDSTKMNTGWEERWSAEFIYNGHSALDLNGWLLHEKPACLPQR